MCWTVSQSFFIKSIIVGYEFEILNSVDHMLILINDYHLEIEK
jgi:hypothetical protein